VTGYQKSKSLSELVADPQRWWLIRTALHCDRVGASLSARRYHKKLSYCRDSARRRSLRLYQNAVGDVARRRQDIRRGVHSSWRRFQVWRIDWVGSGQGLNPSPRKFVSFSSGNFSMHNACKSRISSPYRVRKFASYSSPGAGVHLPLHAPLSGYAYCRR